MVTVCRPSSICTNTFSRQPRIINHSSVKPALAPSFGVTISSPEPTIVAVMIRPGPIWRRIAAGPRGMAGNSGAGGIGVARA